MTSGSWRRSLVSGDPLTPVHATQLGLVWRLAQRVVAYRAGVAEADFQDTDPWAQSSTSATRPTTTSSGVKDRVLKMANLIDQTDDSELLPPNEGDINRWTQNYVNVMGALPPESEEPTPNQLAALSKKLSDGRSPYVDFGVWASSTMTSGSWRRSLVSGDPLTPVHATQLGLVWRLAQRVVAYRAGVAEADFQDTDPWAQSSTSATRPTTTSSGVKDRVLKMANLIDQTDDSELLPPNEGDINRWTQNYVNVMGALPPESEEPTPNQLAALSKKLSDGRSPYVDFGVWGPYERKLSRTHKCRTYIPIGDGSFLQRDLPGPATYESWLQHWRVFKAACLMCEVAPLAALEAYGRFIEKLATQWPLCWGLIYAADDSAGAERFDRLRRHLVVEATLGRQVPRDWDRNKPWGCIMVEITKDEAFWSEKVHVPAAAWVAAGARGTPTVATEAAVRAKVPALRESYEMGAPPEPHPEARRSTSNRDKRLAKRRKLQSNLEELRQRRQEDARNSSSASSNFPKKGAGKGKSKDQSGAPLCFSWASGTGPCGKLPPGAECACPVKRVHKCRKCLSPSHRDADCTAAGGG
eukprot:Skav229880  [mRNA]  locus=scaffold247:351220:353411:+ [translate_table: standard]